MREVRYPIEMIKGMPVVRAPEQLDAASAERLRAVFLESAVRGHGTFVVDLTGTRHCDPAGFRALLRAHHRAVAEHGEVRLVIPGAGILRDFAATGQDRLIPHFGDLARALQRPPVRWIQPRRPVLPHHVAAR
jgi:anti-anti-sigma factor